MGDCNEAMGARCLAGIYLEHLTSGGAWATALVSNKHQSLARNDNVIVTIANYYVARKIALACAVIVYELL